MNTKNDEEFTITYENLRFVLEKKHFFTKERFYHYFSVLGHKDIEIEEYWDIFERFPCYREKDIENVFFVVNDILKYPFPPEYEYHPNNRISYTAKENRKKVYYYHEKKIKNIEFNLNDDKDIVLYADLIKKDFSVIVAVDFVESFFEKSKTWLMYDGDIFSTKEMWFSNDKGEVIVCTKDGYRKLLYTKGRGYIRNGRPDYDEGRYNHNKLTMKDKWRNVGNIYVDHTFLIEKSDEESDTEDGSEQERGTMPKSKPRIDRRRTKAK